MEINDELTYLEPKIASTPLLDNEKTKVNAYWFWNHTRQLQNGIGLTQIHNDTLDTIEEYRIWRLG
ncbi:hypothetical protein RRG54_02245 [Mycoplasmopsis felis]|uniref:hypothetical protein n=1 Tax=Mycoplasmopsis felis TaxID=33923 RepID=UPI00300D95E4